MTIHCMAIYDGKPWCRLRKAPDKRSLLPCMYQPHDCDIRKEAELKASASTKKNGGGQ